MTVRTFPRCDLDNILYCGTQSIDELAGPPGRVTSREGGTVTSRKASIRQVAPASWQRLRTVRTAWPGCSTPKNCSVRRSRCSQHRPSFRLCRPPGRRDIATSRSCRHIKTRHDAGLLTAVGTGHCSLGLRIVESDPWMRLTNPLWLAGHGVLENLMDTMLAGSTTGMFIHLCRSPGERNHHPGKAGGTARKSRPSIMGDARSPSASLTHRHGFPTSPEGTTTPQPRKA